MKVEIYRLRKGGSQKVVATCNLVEDKVVCEGEGRIVESLNTEGILDKSTKPPRRIFPKDGVIFLRSLPANFKSGYLVASDIFEDTPSTE